MQFIIKLLLTSCGFISVAKIVTVIFPLPLNVMRNVNVIKLLNSQLNKTAVSGWADYHH